MANSLIYRRVTVALRNDKTRTWLALIVAALLLSRLNFALHPSSAILLGLLPVAALLSRKRTWGAAACLFALGLGLRIFWFGYGQSDQILVAQAAFDVVVNGGNPYGIGYEASIPPGAPYPYGPIAWAWWRPGPIVELAASVGIMGVLVWRRAILTLALFSCWPLFVILNTSGLNDYSPTLFLVLAVAMAEQHPKLAAVAVAFATGLKLQALAWVPGFFGFFSKRARYVLVATLALLWLPVLWWGPESVLRSVAMVEQIHPSSNGAALEMPALRVLALPLGLLALRSRSITVVGSIGALLMALVMFTGTWGNLGHWVPILVVASLAIEMRPPELRRIS